MGEDPSTIQDVRKASRFRKFGRGGTLSGDLMRDPDVGVRSKSAEQKGDEVEEVSESRS